MQNTGIFALASQQAKWLAVRQQTIAENISHANIPRYAAKDVAPFKALLETGSARLATTDLRHMPSAHSQDGVSLAAAAGDGNPVSIETEMMKTTEVRSQYELNAAIVSAFHRMILTAAKV
jgi:flagellar basal-body rod protein FlgB